MSDSNQDNDSDGGNGFNLGPDILEALLKASQHTADSSENIDSLEAISGEYSSINKTIDELNGFLDRWEERHSRLRNEIQEVITEQEQSQDSSGSCQGTDEAQSNATTTQSPVQDSSIAEEVATKSNSDCDSTSQVVVKDNSQSNNAVGACCDNDNGNGESDSENVLGSDVENKS